VSGQARPPDCHRGRGAVPPARRACLRPLSKLAVWRPSSGARAGEKEGRAGGPSPRRGRPTGPLVSETALALVGGEDPLGGVDLLIEFAELAHAEGGGLLVLASFVDAGAGPIEEHGEGGVLTELDHDQVLEGALVEPESDGTGGPRLLGGLDLDPAPPLVRHIVRLRAGGEGAKIPVLAGDGLPEVPDEFPVEREGQAGEGLAEGVAGGVELEESLAGGHGHWVVGFHCW